MITIDKEISKILIKDAENSFPYEGCGFLFGHVDSNGLRVITDALLVDNITKTTPEIRFEIAAKDYLKAENYAIAKETSLLGIYHSHPDHPPIASDTDAEFAQPFFSYLIVSVLNKKFDSQRSWKLNEIGTFIEETVIENDLIIA